MRVLLADHQTQVRSALRLLLEQETAHDVIGEVSDARGLLAALGDDDADLLLMDWHLPGAGSGSLLRELRRCYPEMFVVVLSGRPELSELALGAGAHAFVSKGDPPETLLHVLQEARLAGDVTLS